MTVNSKPQLSPLCRSIMVVMIAHSTQIIQIIQTVKYADDLVLMAKEETVL